MAPPYNMNVSDILKFFNKTQPMWATPGVSAGITPTSTLAPLGYLQDLPAEARNGIDLSGGLFTGEGAADISKIFPGSNGAAPSFMGKMLGYEGANGYVPGWGGMALSAASGIGQSLMSMKQYGLMEDQLKEQKRQFDINYAMQKKSFNSQVEDRQRARVASNPGAYESVSDYMKKYGA